MNWSDWLTPQGLTALIGAVGTILTVGALILNLLGRKAQAQELTNARDELQANKQQLQSAVSTLRGVIQGVETAKGNMDPAQAKSLSATIQAVATKTGAQALLDPLVQTIQSGKADAPTLLATLKQTIDALQARGATPLVAPAAPPSAA